MQAVLKQKRFAELTSDTFFIKQR